MLPCDVSMETILRCVGKDRIIDVMDVATQSEVQPHMTLGEFIEYYTNPRKKKIYNVISLEVSDTPLSNYVSPPSTVNTIDWSNKIWPKQLVSEFPKVQLYCLMSVKGCFTGN